MKRVVKEYGMTVVVVIATVLLFAFWWQMIREKGTFAQIAETEQVQLELRGRNEEYRRLSEREEPQITYRNQRVYAGERVDGKELFEAVDADGTMLAPAILTVNGETEDSESCYFPRSGIYELEVEATDAYGKCSRMLFHIPVSRKR